MLEFCLYQPSWHPPKPPLALAAVQPAPSLIFQTRPSIQDPTDKCLQGIHFWEALSSLSGISVWVHKITAHTQARGLLATNASKNCSPLSSNLSETLHNSSDWLIKQDTFTNKCSLLLSGFGVFGSHLGQLLELFTAAVIGWV